VLAFVVRGLKEFGEPARKALIIGEAVPELRADLRRLLSHPPLRVDERLVSRRVAVAHQPAGAFSRHGHLRCAGNALVLVVYLPEKMKA
jgi:hypothetical protein